MQLNLIYCKSYTNHIIKNSSTLPLSLPFSLPPHIPHVPGLFIFIASHLRLVSPVFDLLMTWELEAHYHWTQVPSMCKPLTPIWFQVSKMAAGPYLLTWGRFTNQNTHHFHFHKEEQVKRNWKEWVFPSCYFWKGSVSGNSFLCGMRDKSSTSYMFNFPHQSQPPVCPFCSLSCFILFY